MHPPRTCRSAEAISLRMWRFRSRMSSHEKDTSHDTSFAIAGSSCALSRFVCLVKVPLHFWRQGHSLPVGCLFRWSLALHLVHLRYEPLVCSLNKFHVCAGDKRRKIAPIGAHWSLFQKQQEGLFMHTYHWKQTKETKTAAVILHGRFKQRKGTLQQKEERNKNIRLEGAERFWFPPELSPLKRRFFLFVLPVDVHQFYGNQVVFGLDSWNGQLRRPQKLCVTTAKANILMPKFHSNFSKFNKSSQASPPTPTSVQNWKTSNRIVLTLNALGRSY